MLVDVGVEAALGSVKGGRVDSLPSAADHTVQSPLKLDITLPRVSKSYFTQTPANPFATRQRGFANRIIPFPVQSF